MNIFDYLGQFVPTKAPSRTKRLEEEKKQKTIHTQNRGNIVRPQLTEAQKEQREFDNRLKKKQDSFDKWYTPEKHNELFNSDGSIKDFTQDINNLKFDRTASNEEKSKHLKQKNDLIEKQKQADFLRFKQDYDNASKLSEEDRKAFVKQNNRDNNTLVERVGNLLGKTATDIANTIPEAYDVLKEYSDERLANDILANQEEKIKLGGTKEGLEARAEEVRNRFDINDENNLANKVNKKIEEYNSEIYSGLNDIQKFGMQAVDSTTNFAGHLLLSALTGGSSLATMSVQSGVDKAHDLMAQGYDTETAIGNGILTGAMTVLTEKLPIDNVMGILNNKMGQTLLGALTTQAMSEGMEEGAEYLLEPIIDKFTIGTDIDYQPQELLMAMSLGATSGALIGGLATGVNKYKINIKSQKGANQLEADIKQVSKMVQDGQLNDQEIEVVKQALPMYMEALNKFKTSSALSGAVKFEKNNPIIFNTEEIQNNINRFLQPQIDLEQNNIQTEANETLNEIDNNTEQQIAKTQEIAQELVDTQDITQQTLDEIDKGTEQQIEKIIEEPKEIIDNSKESIEEPQKDLNILKKGVNLDDYYKQAFNPTEDFTSDIEIKTKDHSKQMDNTERMKAEFSENADKWIPLYEPIREKYPELSQNNFNDILFEKLQYGDIKPETKAKVENEIIDQIFGSDRQSYIDSQGDKRLNEMLDYIDKAFSSDANYQEHKKFMGKVANKTNKAIRGYDSFEPGYYENKFNKVKQIETIDALNQATQDKISQLNEGVYASMLVGGKDNVSYFKTLPQNLDVVANGDENLRQGLRDVFETPLHQAKAMHTNYLKQYNNLLKTITKDLGIHGGSQESAAVQWLLEGVKADENGVRDDSRSYTDVEVKNEFDYKMPNGKMAYENIIEAKNLLRRAYEEMFVEINKNRLAIYGDVEGKNELETEELRAKVKEARNVLNNISESLKKKPTPEIVAGYDKATKRYNQLINELTTKLFRDDKNDSTRRQILPYKTNYAHHIYKKPNIIERFKNAMKPSQIPTNLRGISDKAKPLTGFSGFFMQQKGGAYTPDAVNGFADYIKDATKMMAYDPYINYIRKANNDIRALAKDNEMGNFVNWVDDYANSLASKTGDLDRTTRKYFNSKFLNSLSVLNSRMARNTLMFNPRTAIVQFANIPNGLGVLVQKGGIQESAHDVKKGSVQFAHDIANEEHATWQQSPFIQERYFEPTTLEDGIKPKMEQVANFMLSKGDELATKYIWNCAYEQGKRLHAEDPIQYADDITSRSVAGRGVGDVPLALQSKVLTALMPFQIETNNAWQTMKSQFGEKSVKGFEALLTTMIASWLMNGLFDELFGDRPLFDPIDAVAESIEEEKTPIETATRLSGEVLSAVPGANYIVQTLAGVDEEKAEELFGDSDPTRYGTGSMGLSGLTDAGINVIEGLNKEAKGEDGKKELLDATSDLTANYLMPGGGKQAQRTTEALQTYGILPQYVNGEFVNEPAYYNKKGNIGFVQDKPTDDIFDFMKNVAFGKWAGKKGQEYLDSFKTSKKETDITNELKGGKDFRDAYNVAKDINSTESLKDKEDKTIGGSKSLLNRQKYEESGTYDTIVEAINKGAKPEDYGLSKSVVDMSNSEFKDELHEVDNKSKGITPIMDALDDSIGKKKAEKVSDRLDKVESMKNNEGGTIRNSRALQSRQALEEMGVYDEVIDLIEQDEDLKKDFKLSNTVMDMSEDKFQSAYNDLMSGKLEFTSKTYKARQKKIKTLVREISQGQDKYAKEINKILTNFVYNDSVRDAEKTADRIRRKYIDKGMKKLLDEYIKSHPYTDLSILGL